MFTHKHYVPIVKSKNGELWALRHLSAAARTSLTPVIEVHPESRKALHAHLQKVCENLSHAWGSERPFFLDGRWLTSAHAIAVLHQEARTASLAAIPVVRLSDAVRNLSLFQRIIEEDGRGCLLRISPSELRTSTSNVGSFLRALNLAPQNVHLLLDYGKSTMHLASDVPRIPHLQRWATFSSASGSFPDSVMNIGSATWDSRSRDDWQTWESGVLNGGLSRNPAFSDYTVRAPGPPPRFGAPVVNVRYTISSDWLVRSGGKVKSGAAPQMKVFCMELVNKPEYSGRSYSAGDEEFYQTSLPSTGPGNATQWVQWAVSHHMEFVTNQIQHNPSL